MAAEFAALMDSWSSPRPALWLAGSEVTWAELAETSRGLRQTFHPWSRSRVGLLFRPDRGGFAALAALDALNCDVFLLDGRAESLDWRSWASTFRWSVVLEPGDQASQWEQHGQNDETGSSEQGSITILTSGTTGKPKAVRHSWASLMRPVRRTPSPSDARWLLTYQPHLYAGLQVILQSFVNGQTLVIPPLGADPNEIARVIVDGKVDHASGTPAYWRRLVLFADRDLWKRVQIAQITLGGEIVDQQILDALHNLFPRARIVHIYATTELGRCFSVSDGKAGFPRSYLDDAQRSVQLRVVDGELQVRSQNAMEGYDPLSEVAPAIAEDDWFCTGDMVEELEDRVCFVGRKSDWINVGGNKVAPLDVERVVRAVPGVADVRVYPRSSSIAGQLVACDLVVEDTLEPNEVKQRVAEHCLRELRSFQRPRIWRLVDAIGLTSADKVERTG